MSSRPRSCAFGLVALLGVASLAHADLRLVDCLPGSFIDISATGTQIAPVNNGTFDVVSSIGNTFIPAGLLRIGMNGGVRLGSGGFFNDDLDPGNGALPNPAAFGGSRALLPYWDDFLATNGPFVFGSIQHEERNGMFIVQWTNVKLRSASVQDRITFQVQIPGSGEVFARFVYLDILGEANGGESATIGFQGTTLDGCAQHVLNASHAVRNGTVLSLINQRPDVFNIGLPGSFIDISQTGTALHLAGDATAPVVTSVRNAIVQDGTLRVGMNGAIRVGPGTDTLSAPSFALPSSGVFGGADALVPFWDDLEAAGGASGDVFVEDRPGDRLIVQWHNVGFNGSSPAQRATFQVQVFHQTDVLAQFLYLDILGQRAAGGTAASIGYQGVGGPGVLQVSVHVPSLQNGSVLTLFGDVGAGAPFCVGNANSRGLVGGAVGRGSRRVSVDDLLLLAYDLPFHSAAYFLVSRDTAFVPLAGGSRGNLCLGGAIGRGVGPIVSTGAAGIAAGDTSLSAMPAPTGPFVVLPGDTLNFQCWYRDAVGGVATSNFSRGLQVQFEP